MNIKGIIQEEIDDFDWIRDIKPKEYGNFNVGDTFTVPDSYEDVDMVYTIKNVRYNDVTITWADDYSNYNDVVYNLGDVNSYISDGLWVLQSNTIKEQDDFVL